MGATVWLELEMEANHQNLDWYTSQPDFALAFVTPPPYTGGVFFTVLCSAFTDVRIYIRINTIIQWNVHCVVLWKFHLIASLDAQVDVHCLLLCTCDNGGWLYMMVH